jgi:hypothetical protein
MNSINLEILWEGQTVLVKDQVYWLCYTIIYADHIDFYNSFKGIPAFFTFNKYYFKSRPENLTLSHSISAEKITSIHIQSRLFFFNLDRHNPEPGYVIEYKNSQGQADNVRVYPSIYGSRANRKELQSFLVSLGQIFPQFDGLAAFKTYRNTFQRIINTFFAFVFSTIAFGSWAGTLFTIIVFLSTVLWYYEGINEFVRKFIAICLLSFGLLVGIVSGFLLWSNMKY